MGYDPNITWIAIDYDRADEGSTQVMVQAELADRDAGLVFKRGREIGRAILRICQGEGWPIPQNRLFAATPWQPDLTLFYQGLTAPSRQVQAPGSSAHAA